MVTHKAADGRADSATEAAAAAALPAASNAMQAAAGQQPCAFWMLMAMDKAGGRDAQHALRNAELYSY